MVFGASAEMDRLRARVQRLEGLVEQLYQRLELEPVQLAPTVPQHILDLVHAGRKIEAIKEYRAATGLGLREAKEAVEAL